MVDVVRACEWDSGWACDKEDVAEVVRACDKEDVAEVVQACEWDSG